MAFDPSYVHTDEKVFEISTRELDYWKDFYPYGVEASMRKKLEPLGEPLTVRVYVDVKHAGSLENNMYHSGTLIYVNTTLIKFYGKRKNIVESSGFGSEFVALRIATEMVEELRYKLSKFCINLEVPEEIYCDNKSVMKNSNVSA